MTVSEILQRFPTQEKSIDRLEQIRWQGRVHCAYCGGERICRHASGDRALVRWQCEDCHRAFSATVGTIFHGTHTPLRSWFLVLATALRAEGAPSASQIARELGMRRATVSRMLRRLRPATKEDRFQRQLLLGLVASDTSSNKQEMQARLKGRAK
jgi:transposase-like protein